MRHSNLTFSLFNLFSLTLFYCYLKDHINYYLKDGFLLKIIPDQTKLYEKPKLTYFLTYYDLSMIMSHV